MLTPRETLPPRPGCGCRGKAGPLGNFGGTRKWNPLPWLLSLTDQSSSLGWRGCGGAWLLHLPVPFLPETQNSLGPPEESPPVLAQKSLPDLWSSAEAAQGTPGSLGGGHSWDRIPGQEPGTGAEAARKSVPFPPRSFCALLTASSHLPSFLPPSPSKLAPGGALTKVEPTEGAGEEGQEVRIS